MAPTVPMSSSRALRSRSRAQPSATRQDQDTYQAPTGPAPAPEPLRRSQRCRLPAPTVAPEPLTANDEPAPEPPRRSKRLRLQAQESRPAEDESAFEPPRRSKRQRVQALAEDPDSEYEDTVEVHSDQVPIVEKDPSQHWTDESGLIRVGTQPIEEVQFIRWTSKSASHASFLQRIATTKSSDPTAILDQDLTLQILEDQQLTASRATSPQQYHELVCGYTGRALTHSPNHGLTYSIEGIYSICKFDDQFSYHVPANITVISWSLNLVKGPHSPLVLALTAQYIKSHQELDIEKRIAEQARIVNAMANTHHFTQAFQLTRNDKESRLASFNNKWKHMAEEYLEAMRTGVRAVNVTAMLDD
ncbi:hypothetical protein B0T21DRAFT_411910 [Apiosordaria backusii]|uniref:Uncharacterized protein n=1 Tax=Apiosordaria backusii TaxID=314023 RepID=A0AA40BM46_9PEZI|nr:hypothetical protein B0T21DRAFT_411910 [Apiosordaria backusii]